MTIDWVLIGTIIAGGFLIGIPTWFAWALMSHAKATQAQRRARGEIPPK